MKTPNAVPAVLCWALIMSTLLAGCGSGDTSEPKSDVITPAIVNPINVLAGRLDNIAAQGATSTLLVNEQIIQGLQDPQSFVVTSSGMIFFRDIYRGLMKIDPNANTIQQVIPTGPETFADGLAAQSTLGCARKIALDPSTDDILIFDCTSIKRVTTTEPMRVTTIVGIDKTAVSVPDLITNLIYSPPSDPTNGTDPRDVDLTFSQAMAGSFLGITPGFARDSAFVRSMLFFALPNGDLYFDVDLSRRKGTGTTTTTAQYLNTTGSALHHLRATDNKVYVTHPHGLCYVGIVNSCGNLSTMNVWNFVFSFDPATSVMTTLQSRVTNGTLIRYAPMDNPPGYPGTSEGTSITPSPKTVTAASGDSFIRVMGQNGKIYGMMSGTTGQLYTYAPPANLASPTDTSDSWTGMFGVAKGECIDGITPSNCTPYLRDAFVTSDSTVYFVDENVIKKISGGVVRTVYGKNMHYGDGGPATSATFAKPQYIQKTGTDTYTIFDYSGSRFREFTIGGNINTIAGNGFFTFGALTLGTTATNIPLHQTAGSSQVFEFAGDPATGNLYYCLGSGSGIAKLDRLTGAWQSFVPSNQVRTLNTGGSWLDCLHAIGVHDGKVIAHVFSNSGDSFVEVYNPKTTYPAAGDASLNITLIGGKSTTGTWLCGGVVGTAINACKAPSWGISPITMPIWDGIDLKWVFANNFSPNVYYYKPGSDIFQADANATLQLLETFNNEQDTRDTYAAISETGVLANVYPMYPAADLTYLLLNPSQLQTTPGGTTTAISPSAVNAAVYRRVLDSDGIQTGEEVVYYCTELNITANLITFGGLYKQVVGEPTATLLSNMPEGLRCTGKSLLWDEERKSLIFLFNQRGVYGVAEYRNP